MEEGFAPVVNKDERSQRRMKVVGRVGALLLGVIVLSAVAFSDSGVARTSLEESAAAPPAPVQALQDAAPVISFPEDYPNSVRHFLLIGFLVSAVTVLCEQERTVRAGTPY